MKRFLLALGVVAIVLPSEEQAQGSQPLRKTDLIRLLANPMISKREVAELISRNCITFRPTPRDWADLRDFGATAEVLSSIGGCATAPAVSPSPPPPPLTATVLTERDSVTVGGNVVVRVQIKRGDVPQTAIPLVLRGSGRIPGAPAQDARAMTAAGGIAVFQFSVGGVPGTYRLAVMTGAGYSLPGATPIDVVVTPEPPSARAEPGDAEPALVEATRARPPVAAAAMTDFVSGSGQHAVAGARLMDPLVFRVRTSAGAPLAGRIITVRAVNASILSDSVVTDSTGLARIEVAVGKQAGPALVTASVDSVEKQAAVVVDAAGPVGVTIERDGSRVDGGTIRVPAGSPFRIRVSPLDPYGNPVSSADVARLIQQLRSGFNVRSRLLKLTNVTPDGASALVTFMPLGVGEVNLSIAGATVSVHVVEAR
ncbi:MAG TPA: hypothetical protein VJN39_03145 [Gemmatimonadales bacterium]|nr:hypothetical protein [Gemmatimonadales bacterium]